jgi:chemotaxis protein CheZ
MNKKDEFLDELMERISEKALESLKDSLTRTLDQEITKSLSRALMDNEFYRTLSEDLRSGLGSVYKEINSARKESSEPTTLEPEHEDTSRLLLEASDQLDQILRTTEQATVDIMDVVERHLEGAPEVERALDRLLEKHGQDPDLLVISRQLGGLQQDLMSIMTTLSFQDITGQRIKRIVVALKRVEAIVLELFLSTGLVLKARAEEPEKGIEELREESRQKVSTLHGPQTDASQRDVDDLLSSLGLD